MANRFPMSDDEDDEEDEDEDIDQKQEDEEAIDEIGENNDDGCRNRPGRNFKLSKRFPESRKLLFPGEETTTSSSVIDHSDESDITRKDNVKMETEPLIVKTDDGLSSNRLKPDDTNYNSPGLSTQNISRSCHNNNNLENSVNELRNTELS
ncbi:unnamed protein product, partial [Trichobilharzia regenti]